MHIAETGAYHLLVCKGWKIVTPECMDAWENIIKNNNETQYKNYRSELIAYNALIQEYILVKGLLLKLCTVVDDADITYLRRKGYNINTSGAKLYKKSLENALRKSDNLMNRQQIKRNEIIKQYESREQQKETFDTVMADLYMGLEFSVDDTLTLARYNELAKLIKAKHRAQAKGFKRK